MHWAATAFASGAPTSVRYAYANYPQCALHNKYGLPAGPFVAPLTTAAPEPAQPAAGHEVAPLAAPLCKTLLQSFQSPQDYHVRVLITAES